MPVFAEVDDHNSSQKPPGRAAAQGDQQRHTEPKSEPVDGSCQTADREARRRPEAAREL